MCQFDKLVMLIAIVNCSLLNVPNNGVINCSLGNDGVPSFCGAYGRLKQSFSLAVNLFEPAFGAILALFSNDYHCT